MKDGTVKERSKCKNDKQDGLQEYWFKDGKLICKETWKHGKRVKK